MRNTYLLLDEYIYIMSQQIQRMGFKVQQKLLALVATYNIYDLATDQQIFTAKRKLFSLTPTVIIYDMAGKELVRVTSNFFFGNKWKIHLGEQIFGEVKFPIFRLCGIKFEVYMANNVYTA